MSRTRSIYRCLECGDSAPKWVGRCPGCEAWNTLVEEPLESERPEAVRPPPSERAVPIAEVDAGEWSPRPTGIGELDRVLGGGLVPGSVTLVGGEPGTGKSTLLLQTAAGLARSGARALYVSAEESRPQVRARAERLGALDGGLWLASEGDLRRVLGQLDEVAPEVLIVDSVQTVHDPDLASSPGSVTQVRECAHRLAREAKERDLTVLLVGHVTKDGALAGPRVLEHLVDTVLAVEGDRHHALRLLRAVKHRFGSTRELGLFEMTDGGMVGVADPSGLFLGDRVAGSPGSVVVPTLEGHRPLLVELQALVAPSQIPVPRRSAQGVDGGRLALLLAVLQRRAGVSFANRDVYASAVGGVRVVEPGADLALALALVSACKGVALPPDLVACGEVGLTGELRQVGQTPRRLAEAARLGFRRVLLPASVPELSSGVRAIRAHSLVEAIRVAELSVN